LVRNPATKEFLAMKTFKSLEEVEAAGLPPPVHDAVHRVVKNLIDAYAEYGETYDPDDDGYARLLPMSGFGE
jgi:hypothetical protein